jgi:DNA-binding MarR family transcriptional regulator
MSEQTSANKNLTSQFLEILQQLNKSNSLEWLQLDLTFQQMKVLYILRQHGSQKMSKLHEELKVTMPTITGIVNRLIERRDGVPLLARETSPDDRREVRARLTQRGFEVTEMLNNLNNKLLERALNQLNSEDIVGLESILGRLQVAISEQRQQDEELASTLAQAKNGHKTRKRSGVATAVEVGAV